MIKMYDEKSNVYKIEKEEEFLFINKRNSGQISNIYFTVYTSGELISDNFKNYFGIHYYNFLYKIIISTSTSNFEFYTTRKKDILKEFIYEGKKINKTYKIKGIQKGTLPIISLFTDTEEIILNNKDFFDDGKYLFHRFKKIQFNKIEILNDIKSSNKSYTEYLFEVKSRANIYYVSLLGMTILFLTVILISIISDFSYELLINCFIVLLIMCLLIGGIASLVYLDETYKLKEWEDKESK